MQHREHLQSDIEVSEQGLTEAHKDRKPWNQHQQHQDAFSTELIEELDFQKS